MSEELARKVEDSFRQQEEISSLLGQVVDLQQRCKVVRDTVPHAHLLNLTNLLRTLGYMTI